MLSVNIPTSAEHESGLQIEKSVSTECALAISIKIGEEYGIEMVHCQNYEICFLSFSPEELPSRQDGKSGSKM